MPQTRSARWETARRYAAASIPVFPCRVGAKEPATPRGFHDASADPAQIDRWWSEADYNIGMVPESAGWCVVDVDNRENWDEAAHPTYAVATPSGGRHFYFTGSLPSSAGKLAPYVDTRGRGSYVLVPPSIIGGREYVVSDDRDFAPLPAWVSIRLGHAERVRATAPADIAFDDDAMLLWAREAIDADLAEYGEPTEGEASDDRTYRFVNKLIDGQHGHSLSPEIVVELLHDSWAPHFDEEWLWVKVDSAQRYRQNPPGCGQLFDPERKYGDPGSFSVTTAPAGSAEMRFDPATIPTFRPWAAIKNAHFDPPQWVWHDRLLAFEPNLYTGDAGVGKTTLAENLAVAVACGVPLLNAATRQTPVALLVAEDHYGPVRDNLAAVAWALGLVDCPGMDNVHTLSVKSDRVPSGHLLARIDDQGRIEDTAFLRERVAPFLRSFDGEVLFIVDPVAELVAYNNLSDQACRALATGFLAEICAINTNRVTVLANEHPSKASMASGAHYAGSVQLKAAFPFFATLIGGAWTGTVHRQRKLTFQVQKGRYAAEDKVEFYRSSASPAFTIAGLPEQMPKEHARRVYLHIVERLDNGLTTGRTNQHDYGPHHVADALGVEQRDVEKAMSYCRGQGWLVYQAGAGTRKDRLPAGWQPGPIDPTVLFRTWGSDQV